MVDARDLAVAQQLADEVRRAQAEGQRKSWRKVTTLLSLFGAGRFTTQVQTRMTEALAAAGVQPFPSLDQLSRADSVRLTVDDLSLVQSETREIGSGDVVAETWPVPVVAGSGFTASGGRATVRWFDVDPNCEAPTILEYLREHCDGTITLEMVQDLLTADPQPKVVEHTAGDDVVRAVSVVGVKAGEQSEGADQPGGESATTTGQLSFQLVEFLVGRDWLVTCWHPSRTCTGSSHELDGAPVLKEQVLARTRHTWATGRGSTGGDLGLHLATALVDTYRQAHRQAEAWLEQWEFKHLQRLDSPETVSLSSMISLVADFRRRLSAFNQAREVTTDRTWFSYVSDSDQAERMDAVLDRALKNLKLLFEAVRSDIELVTMKAISKQAEDVARTANLAAQQRVAGERLRGQLEKIAALLLIPALIAGIFGANTQLPGYGQWFGFIAMLVLMVLSVGAAFAYIRNRDRADAAVSTAAGEDLPNAK